MKNKLQELDFEYTGSNSTEKITIEKGYLLLSGEDLLLRISNKTIFGDYPNGYKFITNIYENGSAEGVNDVGSHDFGNWAIDYDKSTLQLTWQNGWLDTVTRAYDVNGTIQFYDVETGNWRTTFRGFENLEEE